MKCHCGLTTKVLQVTGERSRVSSGSLNMPQRTRVCPVGHHTKTFELDAEELGRLRALAYRAVQTDAWLKAGPPLADAPELRKRRREELEPLVLADLRAGLTRDRIAAKHKASRRTVHKIARESQTLHKS